MELFDRGEECGFLFLYIGFVYLSAFKFRIVDRCMDFPINCPTPIP